MCGQHFLSTRIRCKILIIFVAGVNAVSVRVIVLYDLPRPLDNALDIRRDGLVSLMSRRCVVCGYEALGVIVYHIY